MKILVMSIPFIVGGLTVLQSGLNRHMGSRFGWPVVGLINNACGWFFALLITLILVFFFRGEGVSQPQGFAWWWMLPGILGMIFVMGVPLSIQHIGASQTFVLLVSSQMLFSLGWDYWVLHLAIPWTRIAGIGLAVAGALIASL